LTPLLPQGPRNFPHLPPGRPPGPQSLRRRDDPTKRFDGVSLYGLGPVGLVFGAGQAALQWRAAQAGEEIDVTVAEPEVRRGGQARAVVAPGIHARGGAPLAIRIVCAESHDWVRRSKNHTSRGTADTVVYEQRLELPAEAEREVLFDVPASAPFSHEGEALSYSWRIEARQNVERGVDRIAFAPIWVLPW
jgi:hypothetical protein